MSDERMSDETGMPRHQARRVRHARELQDHLNWLDTFSGTALGVLAVASGIYTYLGVSSLLDDNGAMTVFAAIAYSVAVSVGIFVFWSYLMRLFPAVRTARARIGLLGAMGLGSLAIVAMSSWLNAAALAGSAHRFAPEERQVYETFAALRCHSVPRRLADLLRLGLYRQSRVSTVALWISALIGRL